jgi:hypothetical protein
MTQAKKISIRAAFLALYRLPSNLYTRFRGRKAAFRRAVTKAARLHQKTGRRYRVFFIKNRYRVFDHQDITDFVNRHYFRGKKVGRQYLYKKALFDTDQLEQIMNPLTTNH